MATEVKMPQLGESVTEGTVVRWLKQPGEHVAQDESLAEVETEKVNVEIPSPVEGTLTAHLVPEGETVAVGVPIAAIEVAGAVPAAAGAATPAAAAPTPPPAREAVAAAPARRTPAASFSATGPLGPQDRGHGMFSTGETAPEPAAASTTDTGASSTGGNGASTNGSTAAPVDGSGRFSPAVLRLAREHDVDLKQIRGSGLGGRITRKDVQAFIDRGGTARPVEPGNLGEERQLFTPPMAEPVAPPQAPVVREVQQSLEPPTSGAPPAVEQRPAAQPASTSPARATQPLGPDEELEPLTATRRVIATHMTRSVQTAPHAWMMVEVDVSRLVEYRGGIKDEFKRREGVDLSYLPFMIKATVAALKQYPRLNSSWSPNDEGVILKRRINVGIAMDTAQGLVVPVIHDADNYSVAGLAKRLDDLVGRARSRRLKLEDVQGGSFTIDNVGPIGSVLSQPIINQPQCAIVTMESIVRRPVVLGDAIAVRSMMNCCLSFDHRIVDGGDVGPFMKTLKRNLEAIGEETPIY